MSRLLVAPIVEGHGEVACLRPLLQRLWIEVVRGEHLEVLRPIRQPRDRLVRDPEELRRAVELAALKLAASGGPAATPSLVLVLLDAEEDPVCELAPELLNRCRASRPDLDVACVLAKREYETWFVAAAASLGSFLNLSPGSTLPNDPETTGQGKGWIEERFRGAKYTETLDQPAMTAAFDLLLCRRRSPSFDKLCRELEARRR